MTRRRLAFALCAAGIAASGLAAGAPSAGAKDFSPAVQRKLALTTKNNMTDSRLPGAVVGVWVPGRGSYVRSFGIDIGRRVARSSRPITFESPASRRRSRPRRSCSWSTGPASLDDHLSQYVPVCRTATPSRFASCCT